MPTLRAVADMHLILAICTLTAMAEEVVEENGRAALYDQISFTNIKVRTSLQAVPPALAVPRQAGAGVRAGEVSLRTNVNPGLTVQSSEVLLRTNAHVREGLAVRPPELAVPRQEAQAIRANPSFLTVSGGSAPSVGSGGIAIRTNAAPAMQIAAQPPGLVSRIGDQLGVRAGATLLRANVTAPAVLRAMPVSLGIPRGETPRVRAQEAALAFHSFRELSAAYIDTALVSNTLSDAEHAASTNNPWLREDLAWLIRARMFEPEAYDAFKALLKVDASGVVARDVERICSWATNAAGGRYEEALLYNAAYHLYRTMEYGPALKYTDELSSKFTNHADHVTLLRASSFIGQGKHDAALVELEQFRTNMVKSPLLPRAKFLTAYVYVYSRKPDLARPILEEIAQAPEGEYQQRAVELLNTIARQQARKKPVRSKRR